MAIPLSVQLAQIGRYLKPLVLRDELAYKGDPHASAILSSRRFIVAYKREDRMPTSSTCQKAYLGIDVAKLKLDVVSDDRNIAGPLLMGPTARKS
jgi:hypothetical protein